MSLLKDLIREALEAARPTLTGIVSIWLFGSALHTPEPTDVDLLLVYDAAEIPPERALTLRATVHAACASVSVAPIDVVLLSTEEASATQFAALERAELVYEQYR